MKRVLGWVLAQLVVEAFTAVRDWVTGREQPIPLRRPRAPLNPGPSPGTPPGSPAPRKRIQSGARIRPPG